MIKVDDKEILSLFAKLDTKKQQKTFNQAIRKASQILVKETKKELRKVVKNATRKRTWKNGKTTSLIQGVKLSKVKDGVGKVHIMGDFRLKFFEMGTKPRKTKKGWNRGYIGKKPFFYYAKQNKEKEIFDNLDKYLSDAIIKQIKK